MRLNSNHYTLTVVSVFQVAFVYILLPCWAKGTSTSIMIHAFQTKCKLFVKVLANFFVVCYSIVVTTVRLCLCSGGHRQTFIFFTSQVAVLLFSIPAERRGFFYHFLNKWHYVDVADSQNRRAARHTFTTSFCYPCMKKHTRR